MCPKRGLPLTHPTEPQRVFMGWSAHFLQSSRLAQPQTVEINRAGMVLTPLVNKPISVNQIFVRIKTGKQAIGQNNLPKVR